MKQKTLLARLERRQANTPRKDGFKRAGSLNPHKPAAHGDGRRSQAQVKADSRRATQ